MDHSTAHVLGGLREDLSAGVTRYIVSLSASISIALVRM